MPFKPRMVLMCPAVERQGLTCGVYAKAKPFFPHYPTAPEIELSGKLPESPTVSLSLAQGTRPVAFCMEARKLAT